jgi:hypothetical protein
MKFRFRSEIGFAEIIALIAVIFTLCTSYNNYQKQEREYLESADSFRPYFELLANNNIDTIDFQLLSLSNKNDKLIVDGNFLVNDNIKLINTSKTKVNILAIFITSSMDDSDILRKSFFTKIAPDIVYFDDRNTEVLPGDTLIQHINKKIRLSGNKFKLHWFILYTNDLGYYYDYYYWLEYEINDSFILKKNDSISKNMIIDLPVISTDSKPSTFSYNKKETGIIKKRLSHIIKLSK